MTLPFALLCSLATLVFVALPGCGSDGTGDGTKTTGTSAPDAAPSPSSSATGSSPSTLPCQDANNAGTCDPGTQYCIESYSGSVVESGLCAPLPSGCASCDCFEKDAQTAWTKANPGTSDCSSEVSCSGSNAGVTISCLH